jgi:secondary thiamine-phosphate synthase enzyme
MHTLTRTARSTHAVTITVDTTSGTAFVDITERLASTIAESGIHLGTVTVQTLHTTTGVVVNEREPLLLCDFARTLGRLAPADAGYAHDDMIRRRDVPADEPANGHAHCRALFLPTSLALAVVDGHLVLGRWQSVFLVELDGPRRRTLSVVAQGEAL